MTIVISIIATLLSLVCAVSPLYIVGYLWRAKQKDIDLFETVTALFCIPLAVFYWGKFFIPTITFPLYFEIAAGIGLILLLIFMIRNKKEAA